MNDLEEFFYNKPHRLMHKWEHYFPIYEQWFSKFRGKSIDVLEIGVSHGGSLQMWKDYFGVKAMIFGVDKNMACRFLEEDRINIIIADQSEEKHRQYMDSKLRSLDVIIDDGSHRPKDQIKTFETLFYKLRRGGVYLVEDVHTSYQKGFGFGSFVRYAKKLADKMHIDPTSTIGSIHIYNSVVVITKDPVLSLQDVKLGTVSINDPLADKLII